MFRRPVFKAPFHVAVVSPDLVVVAHDAGFRRLEGRIYPLLVPWIDGEHSVNEIVDQLQGRANPVDVHFGLTLLNEQGLLAEREDRWPRQLAALRDALGLDADVSDRRLQATRVSVQGVAGIDSAPLAALLASLHVRVEPEGDFHVVLTEDLMSPEVAAFNRRALHGGLPWMLLYPRGGTAWIGPVFRPGATACWECLATRLRANLPELELVAPLSPAVPRVPHLDETMLRIAALQILRWVLAEEHPDLEGRLLTFDPLAIATRWHTVSRLAHCPACGRSGLVPGTAVRTLETGGRIVSRDGGYRSASPEETLQRYEHLVSPLTGVVGYLERRDIRGLGEIVVADHAFRSEGKAERRRSAGKGLGASQSRASALCEALERYSGVFRGDEERRLATLDDLGSRALHPADHLRYSAAQYGDREAWNRHGERYLRVPERFDPSREVPWTALWSLAREDVVYLPSVLCYYDHPIDPEHDFGRADSNGTAAGNRLDEAILQGFLELVERDAVALWWYGRCRRPGLDLASFGEGAFLAIEAGHRELGREVHTLDLTHDLGIPVVAALSLGDGMPLLGFGAHLDASIAVARALTEMNQFLPGWLAGSPRRIVSGELEDDRFLRPGDEGLRCRDDFEDVAVALVSEALDRCLTIAAARELEVLVLDQTRSDIGLSVVRVLIPGLRHYWARLAPGRLYDVPAQLGWVERTLREDELNPCHLLI